MKLPSWEGSSTLGGQSGARGGTGHLIVVTSDHFLISQNMQAKLKNNIYVIERCIN